MINWFILNWYHYKFVKCFAIWHCWNNWALGSEYFTIVANIFETFWNYLTNTRKNVFPVKKNRAMPCLSWCWFRSFLQANDNRSTWAMVQECARDAVTGPTWDRHKCGTSYHHFLKLKSGSKWPYNFEGQRHWIHLNTWKNNGRKDQEAWHNASSVNQMED